MTAAGENQLSWKVTEAGKFSLAEFCISGQAGLLRAADLPAIALPPGLPADKGLILSGRGPVWLYAHLAHLPHCFAWLAVHDPRLGGAVVVARHLADAPGMGELVGLFPKTQDEHVGQYGS